MSLLGHLIQGISTYRRFFLLATLGPTFIAALLSLWLPKYYRAQSSVLPVNSRLSDKGRFTGEEIAELYSLYGNGDDLDRLQASATSENLLQQLVDSFNLVNYYRFKAGDPAAREKAVRRLRKHTEISRTENGELKLIAWDRSPAMSLALVEAMTSGISRSFRDIHLSYYGGIIASLQQSITRQGDSVQGQQAEMYQRSLTEARIALDNPPPAFAVVEKAVLPVKADRPRFWVNTLLVLAVSLFVSLAVLLLRPASSLPKA